MSALQISPSLTVSSAGLYCPVGDFYVDPWLPVERAVITHSHADHVRSTSSKLLTASANYELLTLRSGPDARIDTLAFGESRAINGVKLSFHPAGHILGSSQVLIEYEGHRTVVTGDYKTSRDQTCEEFELVPCDTIISESTFGLPIFQWQDEQQVFAEINAWWEQNSRRGQTSILFGYSLGKAQRLLAGVDPQIGPIVVHSAIAKFLPAYRRAGVSFPQITDASLDSAAHSAGKALVITPPSSLGSSWLAKFKPYETAFASGWMAIRGMRRRRNVDRGFVLSDHADWNGLLHTIAASGADHVWLTHGYMHPLSRFLQEQGVKAEALPMEFSANFGAPIADPAEPPGATSTAGAPSGEATPAQQETTTSEAEQ